MLIKERIRSLWGQILSLRGVPILKRDAIEGKHCLIQSSPFDVPNFSVFWVRHCEGNEFQEEVVSHFSSFHAR